MTEQNQESPDFWQLEPIRNDFNNAAEDFFSFLRSERECGRKK